jgi:hypothetical protein
MKNKIVISINTLIIFSLIFYFIVSVPMIKLFGFMFILKFLFQTHPYILDIFYLNKSLIPFGVAISMVGWKERRDEKNTKMNE